MKSDHRHQSNFNLMMPWPTISPNPPSSPTRSRSLPGCNASSGGQRSSGEANGKEKLSGTVKTESQGSRRITRSTAQSLLGQANDDSRRADELPDEVLHEKGHNSERIVHAIELDTQKLATPAPVDDSLPRSASSTSCSISKTMIRSETFSPSKGDEGEPKCAICSTTELGDRPRERKCRVLCSICCEPAKERVKAQSESAERKRKARDDAVLLPPPSKHRVTTKLSEHFELLKRVPKTSSTLPPPQLNASPAASSEPLLSSPSQPPTPCNDLHNVGHQSSSRQIHSNPMLGAYLPPQTALPYNRTAPYRLSNNTSSPLDPSPYSRVPQKWGYGIHTHHQRRAPPIYLEISLTEIKRRRSLLLDFRDCALDLLDETSKVLSQLETASMRLSDSRQRAGTIGLGR